MRVKLSKRTERAVERIDAYWRKHADHPEIFLLEMLATIGFLETVSEVGTPCPTKKRPRLTRIFLEKSKCHVYFVVNEHKQMLEVLTVWDGRRERPPKL